MVDGAPLRIAAIAPATAASLAVVGRRLRASGLVGCMVRGAGDLRLDALEERAVGVAERLDALALELVRQRGQIDPAAAARSTPPRASSAARAAPATPWSANARSVLIGIVLITPGAISSST